MSSRRITIFPIIFGTLIATVISCVEPYDPNVLTNAGSYLVVDAHLDATQSVVNVRLTRTVPLEAVGAAPPELNASVTLEHESGTSINLIERGGGVYSRSAVPVDLNGKYRLHIRSGADEVYSDFVPVVVTPAIDSIHWLAERDGLTIYADSHDPTGKVRYQKWDYVATFEYTSAFTSVLKIANGSVEYRPPSEAVYRCWKTNTSTEILVGSNDHLREAVFSHFPIKFLPAGKLELSRKYSILVKQQGLTEEGYNYWTALKRTTESLGGLFDPMPTEITGNFYSAKTTDPVLGFFTCSTMQEERIFIDFYELPQHLQQLEPRGCFMDSIPANQIRIFGDGTYLIDSYGYPTILGYLTSRPECIDCQKLGGTLTRPSFWE